MIFMKNLFMLAFLSLSLANICEGEPLEIRGKVKSQTGIPIEGVIVYSNVENVKLSLTETKYPFRDKTNSQGEFTLLADRIVFFKHPQYRPLLKMLDPNINYIEVTLEEGEEQATILPLCRLTSKNSNAVGHSIKIPSNKTLHKNISRGDVEYHEFLFDKAKLKERMIWIFGPFATNEFPDDQWILASQTITLHALILGEARGIDIKGVLQNGRRWRFLRKGSETIYYYDIPQKASSYFDLLISQSCAVN